MRKILMVAASIFWITGPADAQVRVGPFLGYGDQLGLWGLGAYAEIIANEKVSISAVFTQYFPESLENIPRRTVWEVNGNVNYYIIRGQLGYLYGLAGINYTHIKIKTRTAIIDEVENDGNIGLNFGLGTMWRVTDLLLPFAEVKYTAGGYSQLSLIFGVKFQLGDETLDDDY